MASSDLYYNSLHGLMPPASVIYGVNVKVHELVANLISYYFPDIESIWDPTCGEENYQFANYLRRTNDGWLYRNNIRYVASDIKETKWNCYNDKCLKIDLLKPPYPFGKESFDIIVYDPPFIPRNRGDERGKHYDIDTGHDIDFILKYYGENVFREFYRIAKRGIIVKGMDFYYPSVSDNLYLFIPDILDIGMIRKYFRIVALHIYRFFVWTIPLLRARVGKSVLKRGYRRSVIVHTYYLILYKRWS